MNERRSRVLEALIAEYITSAQPVGSKTLVERYELGCSPATVRNELSILEETGYVVQPHVSAGRLPTDVGYRDHVDRLLQQAVDCELTPATIPQVTELDELMREASATLTRLTDSLAVVLAPSVLRAGVKRVDLLSMGPKRALFVLITEDGRVVDRQLELDREATPEDLASIERSLNASLVGKRAADIVRLHGALEPRAQQETVTDDVLAQVMGEIIEVLGEVDRDRLYHVGVPALLAQPEFHDAERARPLIEYVEDGLTLLEILSSALSHRGVTVTIGHENDRVELGGVSIVTIDYGGGASDGVIGVIGPTRMDYRRAIDAVRAVADGLSRSLS